MSHTIAKLNPIEKLSILTGLKTLPKDIYVSTMTIICKFDCQFFINNIGRYIELSEDGIMKTKYAVRIKNKVKNLNDNNDSDEDQYEDVTKIRMVAGFDQKKKSSKKKKKKKDSTFYNQAEVKVRCKTDDKTVKQSKKGRAKKILSVKLFRNGTAHFTGCATIDGLCEVIETLTKYLRETKAIMDYSNNKPEMKEIRFSTNPDALYMIKIKETSVSLINTNFVVDFNIDRVRLKNLMHKLNIPCKYKPIKYSGVIVKYNYKDIRKVSVSIFKSGAIVITGGKSCNQVKYAYNYICNLLKEYKNEVIEITGDKDNRPVSDEFMNVLDSKDLLIQQQVQKILNIK